MKKKTWIVEALWKDGAYSFKARTDEISSSGPAWSAMLTGVWHQKHNILNNEYEDPDLEHYPHFYHRIILSSDHGGSNFGHGKSIPEHMTVFFIASGESAIEGEISGDVGVVDVAITALYHLGISAKEEWDLDGRVSGL